ncbi:glycosyltransferase [Escherichia coli]|uniref:glycosyltransferase n=1 Tax=Escherichia coli TaxID=562 RepID=UPI0007A60628|nr:glycosyltransferase [Escherichia coli]MCW9895268.1 glycosyltransferase [Escherichia coli]
MNKYGIYICFPPGVDLRHEGLGRYLAAFIKGAEKKENVQFTLLCPSWSVDDIYKLFESEGVPLKLVDIISPKGTPVILNVYKYITALKNKKKKNKKSLLNRFINRLKALPPYILSDFEKRVSRAYSVTDLIPVMLYGILLVLLVLIFTPFYLVLLGASILLRKIKSSSSLSIFRRIKRRVSGIFFRPKDDSLVLNLYDGMIQAETERMHTIIESLKDIKAWYSPTAFWDSFTAINAPKMMCVPDVVLTQFPTAFSQIGGERVRYTYNKIIQAINKNDFFVTYSNDVKQKTLVEHFNINPDNVYVVPHAPNRLDQWLDVIGFPDTKASSDFYAQQLMLVALSKQKNAYIQGLGSDFKFIFYASQARPNKNIITLLKAYNYLLKEKFWGHKLILTCGSDHLSSISNFIKENRLEYDVLFLHGLSIQELAALYKRADLAVNPTLSEGGCPFTFTEALSVGTPVIMSRIPVAEEVLTDPALQEMTFFDPLDWKCLADKILWAVDNLDELKTVQMQTYNQLIQRNWEDVVNEHIDALDAIADRTRVTYEHS